MAKSPEFNHELKVWPDFFNVLASGDKTFEIRKDDRGFREHDVLLLREYSPGTKEYTGRDIKARVTYCLRGNEVTGFAFGLRPGFVAMGLAVSAVQDRADAAIARQLARSMKMNARLKVRLTALRSCVQTVMNISGAFDLCAAAVKEDDEMKAASD